MNQTPNKNHDPQQDAHRMLNQVSDAFSLPWPRKPLSGGGKGAKGGKGPGPTAGRAARRSVRPRRGPSAK